MRALVLSGGGSAGAYHLGVIEELLKSGARYDILSGVSVGALIIAAMGQFPKEEAHLGLEVMKDIFFTKSTKDIHKKWGGFPASLLWRPSLYDTTPLKGLIKQYVTSEKARASGVFQLVGTVSLDTGRYVTFNQNSPHWLSAVQASASYPVAYPPVTIAGQRYTDGGIRTVTPVEAAHGAGATEIDTCVCGPQFRSGFPKLANFLDYSLRYVDILVDQIGVDDLRWGSTRFFRPQDPVVSNSLRFDPEEALAAYTRGKADAQKTLNPKPRYPRPVLNAR